MWTGARKAWQRTMIALARSARTKAFMQSNRPASFLASKYVAGDAPVAAAEKAARLLREKGFRASLYYLGEYVDTRELVRENVANELKAVEALRAVGLDIHISVDPTQIGHQISPSIARENAEIVAEAVRAAGRAAEGVNCLMLDMEDRQVTDATIALHDGLRARGLPVALTLQAYLRRTALDLKRQIETGSKVRLVKGAFAEAVEIAFQGDLDIKHNFRELIYQMFSPHARNRGFYPIVATHDTSLHDLAIGLARKHGWQPGQYEFELLLGVRSSIAASLARRGERVRLYLPFGRDWWPYAIRRIGENPASAILLGRSLFD